MLPTSYCKSNFHWNPIRSVAHPNFWAWELSGNKIFVLLLGSDANRVCIWKRHFSTMRKSVSFQLKKQSTRRHISLQTLKNNWAELQNTFSSLSRTWKTAEIPGPESTFFRTRGGGVGWGGNPVWVHCHCKLPWVHATMLKLKRECLCTFVHSYCYRQNTPQV